MEIPEVPMYLVLIVSYVNQVFQFLIRKRSEKFLNNMCSKINVLSTMEDKLTSYGNYQTIVLCGRLKFREDEKG